jgi:hypothetical protein
LTFLAVCPIVTIARAEVGVELGWSAPMMLRDAEEYEERKTGRYLDYQKRLGPRSSILTRSSAS